MGRYRDDPAAVSSLVRDAEVHRDVYTDPEIFALEMEHLFPSVWVYVGHDSEVPEAGDYLTTGIGNQPLLIARHSDGLVRVFHNRCPHKGTRITAEPCGNTGAYFRCPYHAWSFHTDGSLKSIPLRKGYEDTGFDGSHAERGLTEVASRNYRGFVFARLAPEGISFEDYFGESLSSIDNMVDRSPAGRLILDGAPLRFMHRCNWKMLIENQTDTCHPMVAHEASVKTALAVWEEEKVAREARGESVKPPMSIEALAPFLSPYEFMERMGTRVWPNGHGHSGVTTSIHADYSAIPGYEDAMIAAYGVDRAKRILSENRHNTIYFPNIMVKGPIQTLRVFRPLAADRTLIESYTFRLVEAPDMLLERTMMYNRLINAPTSIVGHDDLEMFERAQEGLASDGYVWVNLQRLYRPGEDFDAVAVDNGTTERQMRNQFRAWQKFIVGSMEREASSAPSMVQAEAAE